jgi:hypothetical protein
MVLRWRALGVVLRDAWPVGVAILGVLVASLVGCTLSTTTSSAVRYAGTALEILGLGTVAVGLHHTRQLFGQPTVPSRVGQWFGALLRAFRRPDPTVLEIPAMDLSMVGERPRLRSGAGAGASLEERLTVLEGNLNQLQGELDADIQAVREAVRRQEEDLRREHEVRRQGDDHTMRQVEGAAIGGLHLELVGLFWLVLGLVGSNLPDEIARLIYFLRG